MTGLLTSDDRADMLASLTESWTQTATIQRNDGADTWVTVASNVPCRAMMISRMPEETIIAGELRAVIPWLVNLPTGTDARPTDRLTIAGRTFEITGSTDPLDQALIRQVRAVEIG